MHLLSLRNTITKELYKQEPLEVQNALKEALDTAHNELVAEYNELSTGLPSANPEDHAL
jgi:hypothetical protein